jgi:hypothetical protein
VKRQGGRWPRVNWMLFWTALGALAAVGALLLTIDLSPSDQGAGAEKPPPPKTDGREERSDHKPDGAEQPQGKELWSGEISLVVNENYALDGFPIEQVEGYCEGCIMVNSFTPEISLEVENGVRNWPQPNPPSFDDCAQLLESGPAPSVFLVTSPNSEGLWEGDWACAYSKSGELLRLQYLGESEDGVNFRFKATGWSRPS